MFHMEWCAKQKIFSMCGVPFVERTSIGTAGNTNYPDSTHMHILIINYCNNSHILLTRVWLQLKCKLNYIQYPNC